MLKKDIKNFRISILYIFAAVLYGINKIAFPIYALYFISVFIMLYQHQKERRLSTDLVLTRMMIYSIILPDNYLIVFIIYLSFCVKLLLARKIVINKIVLLLLVSITISTVINMVPILNVAFAFIFFVPFFLCYVFFENMKFGEEENLLLKSDFILILFTQVISVLSYGLFHIRIIFKMPDFDWVSGTFGYCQGTTLYIVMIMLAVYFAYESNKEKKINKGYVILSVVLALSTGSISFTIITAIVVIGFVMILPNIKNRYKIVLLSSVIFGMMFLLIINKEWVLVEVFKIFQGDFSRVEKLDSYYKTFIEIPNENVLFCLFGTGMGYYASRAALACTGIYLDFFDGKSMSTLTQEYIYPGLLKNYQYNLGMTYTPYSSIIALRGEFGIIGFVLFCSMLLKMCLHKNYFLKFLVVFYFSMMFTENYLEFPKIQVIFFLIYFLINREKDNIHQMMDVKEDIKELMV